MKKKDLIIASSNQHKIDEMKAILSSLEFQIESMKEAGVDIEIEETGKTFEENALIKARAIADLTGKIVLADDSGLEVDALDNAPGVYSARYAGEHGNDRANNEKLLEELKDVPFENRKARFCCAIAMVFPEQREIVVRGECEGRIATKYIGNNGFGYDPLFIIPELGKTFAQLKQKEKNQISHRAKALEKLKKVLQDR
ncbi:XTP/dITP diphosphatase [Garciella nitratireducens]|uniref:dITP/XTP pyrophosphatase n=1 Tax=Garciella nitratireducens DSM 15102 TaxID=1121911 RepID=A0A1T4PJA3_9FIRM|nr:XTP/dITP diphosphatase [Garciella nitratireducens]SJZ90948.1 XTP/dITP diphosphohydrolase [Garciella nitratireducens DSM 15102]